MTNQSKQIEQFNLNLSKLIGKKLEEVHYFEINQDEPNYNCLNYHRLDFGLTLLVESELYYIVWSDAYLQFDIKFGLGSIEQEFNIKNAAVEKHNMAYDSNWSSLLGQKIVEVKSFWSWRENMTTQERIYYPKDICIKFEENKTVYFSCTCILNDGTYLSSADEIVVFFDCKKANEFGVGIGMPIMG